MPLKVATHHAQPFQALVQNTLWASVRNLQVSHSVALVNVLLHNGELAPSYLHDGELAPSI